MPRQLELAEEESGRVWEVNNKHLFTVGAGFVCSNTIFELIKDRKLFVIMVKIAGTLLEQLKKAESNLFNQSDCIDSPYQTKEDKVKRLCLSDKRIEQLKQLTIKEFGEFINLQDYELRGYEHIDVDKIVGYEAHNPKSWYDALDNNVCHKIESFIKYDSNTFPEYINQESNIDDLPCVIEKEGEYYIRDGTHRLSIAKVTGCKKAYVLVLRKKMQ